MDRDRPSPGSAEPLLQRLGFNVACLPNRPLEETLEIGARIGLGAVELLAFAGYRHTAGELAGVYFDDLTPGQMAELRELVADFEHVSVHAPFWDIVPFSPNPAMRAASRRQVEGTVRVAGQIGAETVTTHVVPRHGYDLHEYRDDVLAHYRHLGDVAREAGVTVTIETGFPREIDEFAALLHDIDHENVGANIDVGHLRGLLTERQRLPDALAEAYNALLRDHVRSLEDRIYHLHLHDVQAEGVRDHRECGTGVIDYEGLFALLRQQSYEGLAVFELEEADDIGALERSRERITAAMRRARPCDRS